jgi:hypothetical protein
MHAHGSRTDRDCIRKRTPAMLACLQVHFLESAQPVRAALLPIGSRHIYNVLLSALLATLNSSRVYRYRKLLQHALSSRVQHARLCVSILRHAGRQQPSRIEGGVHDRAGCIVGLNHGSFHDGLGRVRQPEDRQRGDCCGEGEARCKACCFGISGNFRCEASVRRTGL